MTKTINESSVSQTPTNWSKYGLRAGIFVILAGAMFVQFKETTMVPPVAAGRMSPENRLKHPSHGTSVMQGKLENEGNQPGVSVVVKNDINVHVGAGSNMSAPGGGGGAVGLGGGAGDCKKQYGVGNALTAPAITRWGHPLCPCIGFDGLKQPVNGELGSFIDFGKTPEGAVKASGDLKWNSQQPGDYGAHCSTWPRPGTGGPETTFTSTQPWCFVDAFNCRISVLKSVPKRSLLFTKAKFQGKNIYYSYATCGGTDEYTATGNLEACPSRLTEECEKDGKCTKVDASFHPGLAADKLCVGKEIAVEDPKSRLQETALKLDGLETSEGGLKRCRCIGFGTPTGGLHRRQYQAKTGTGGPNNEGIDFPITGNTGSYCKAWDSDQHPFCKEHSGGDRPDWCDHKWCYVDGCDCKGLAKGPFVTTYLREGGNFQGHNLYYSYATCGADNSYTGPTWTPRACSSFDGEHGGSEADCVSEKTLNRCTWIPPSYPGGMGQCVGNELVNKAFCSIANRDGSNGIAR